MVLLPPSGKIRIHLLIYRHTHTILNGLQLWCIIIDVNYKSMYTWSKPYFVSTSYKLYSLMSDGKGEGRFSQLPSILAKLALTGSVQNARQSLKEKKNSFTKHSKRSI